MPNELIYAIFFVLPAMIANASPIIYGGGTPIAKNIFGKNKTIIGFIAGVGGGVFCALMLFILTIWPFDFYVSIYLGLLQGFVAMLGDLVGSFVKRQLKIVEGDELIILDQLGFMAFALMLSNSIIKLNTGQIIFVFFVTFLLHKATNVIAFVLKLKDRAH